MQKARLPWQSLLRWGTWSVQSYLWSPVALRVGIAATRPCLELPRAGRWKCSGTFGTERMLIQSRLEDNLVRVRAEDEE